MSLLPYLADPGIGTLPQRPYAYAETFGPNGSGPYTNQERAIRDESYKLIWRNGAYEELYHLDDDRWEEDNLLLSPLDPGAAAAFASLAAHLVALHGEGEAFAPTVPSLGLTGTLCLVLCLGAAGYSRSGIPMSRFERRIPPSTSRQRPVT